MRIARSRPFTVELGRERPILSPHWQSPTLKHRAAEDAGKPIVICVDDDRTNLNALGRVLRARCTVLCAIER